MPVQFPPNKQPKLLQVMARIPGLKGFAQNIRKWMVAPVQEQFQGQLFDLQQQMGDVSAQQSNIDNLLHELESKIKENHPVESTNSGPALYSENIYLNYAPPGHYYSTIPNYDELRSDQERIFSTEYKPMPGVRLDVEKMLALLERMKPFAPDFPYTEEDNPKRRFILGNGTYSIGDAIVFYSMMRLFQPRRIIEIGSGMSTCLMLDLNELFFENAIKLSTIDPFPERMLGIVKEGDTEKFELVVKRLQDIRFDRFQELEANDILFIDSTHVSKCDSDVNHIFFDVLPVLKPGVLVHFHDVFYPFEYPRRWLMEVGAAWNENYLLHAFLQYNTQFEIIFFCDYLNHFHSERIGKVHPLYAKALGFNFWLQRVKA